MKFRGVVIVVVLFVAVLSSQPLFAAYSTSLRERAENNDSEAQFNLGLSYEYGNNGVEKNLIEAVKWYRKSANLGNAKAQFCLGVCYANGNGVVQNYAEAVKWYRRGAEQGCKEAQLNLGVCYEYGDGVDKDFKEALTWYFKAALQGNDEAQYKVGFWLLMAKKPDEAVQWLQKSAKQGNERAKNAIKAISEQ